MLVPILKSMDWLALSFPKNNRNFKLRTPLTPEQTWRWPWSHYKALYPHIVQGSMQDFRQSRRFGSGPTAQRSTFSRPRFGEEKLRGCNSTTTTNKNMNPWFSCSIYLGFRVNTRSSSCYPKKTKTTNNARYHMTNVTTVAMPLKKSKMMKGCWRMWNSSTSPNEKTSPKVTQMWLDCLGWKLGWLQFRGWFGVVWLPL